MEDRLSRRDLAFVAIALLLTAGALTLGAALFPRAFPEATIDLRLDRAESRARAESLRAALGDARGDWLHASRFVFDAEARSFLEREMGLARADSAYSVEIRLWRWAHRWFRPGLQEEWQVEIATTGELARLAHRIGEDAPGAALAGDEARARAEAFLREQAALDLDRWEPVAGRTLARPRRVDHAFTYELRERRWAGAPLRAEVTVQGDRVGGFELSLAVPEAWSRGYVALRSRNETTGAVAGALYGLVLLGAAAACVRRMARGRVRWRVATGFALAALVLVLLAQANGFRAALFDYPTTEGLSAFLAGRLLAALVQAVGLALLIFFLTAGAESVYRESYPEKLSLEGSFTRRGLRTRRFFLAMTSGYALAALFFAYQTAFYCVAARLGAWAPAEVPYDELLTTSLPWAYVLLIGFAPAVTEELSMRAFAIPVLSRLLRSRWPALLLAGAIWGFGHAAYPNQPFYIRGLEVGLAGVLVGWVMLRGEILTLLVWHYTVDAFYAALLLMRSRDAYLAGSALLAAGLLLLPWLCALVALLRTGRFRSPQGLLNREVEAELAAPGLEGQAASLEREAPGLEGQAASLEREAPIEREAAIDGPASIARRPPSDPPIPLRRWAAALGLTGLLLVALAWLPGRGWSGAGRIEISARAAETRGRAELLALGAPLERLRLARRAEGRLDPALLRHGEREAGGAATEAWIRAQGGARGWLVRAFAPREAEEWRVMIGALDGRLLMWERRVADAWPADSLGEERALAVAAGELSRRGIDQAEWTLAESRALPRPARRDWEFVWEPRARDARSDRGEPRLGRATARLRVRLIGGEVAGFSRTLYLPSEVSHADRRRGPLAAASAAGLGVLLVGTIVLTLRRLRRGDAPGRLAWRPAAFIAGAIALLQLGAAALEWPARLMEYDPREPWGLFAIRSLVAWPANALLLGLSLAIGFALWPGLLPRVAAALGRGARRAGARDAILSGLLAGAWMIAAARAGDVLAALAPGAQAPAALALPPGIDAVTPLPAALLSALTAASLTALALGLARFLLPREGAIPPAVIGLALCATLAFLPQPLAGVGAFAAAWIPLAWLAAAALLLVRFWLRENGPAYLTASLAVGLVHLALSLRCAPQGAALLAWVCVTAIAGAAVFFARGHPSPGSE